MYEVKIIFVEPNFPSNLFLYNSDKNYISVAVAGGDYRRKISYGFKPIEFDVTDFILSKQACFDIVEYYNKHKVLPRIKIIKGGQVELLKNDTSDSIVLTENQLREIINKSFVAGSNVPEYEEEPTEEMFDRFHKQKQDWTTQTINKLKELP